MRNLIRRVRWLHWTARVYGSAISGFWLLVGILESSGEQEPFTWESTGVVFFIIAMAAATVFAWRNARRGGWLLVILAALFSTFALFSAGRNHAFAMLVSGGPFLVSGLLFLAGWWTDQRHAKLDKS